MTKFFPIILTCTMLIGLTACGNNPPPSKITSAVQPSNALATTVSVEKITLVPLIKSLPIF